MNEIVHLLMLEIIQSWELLEKYIIAVFMKLP